MHNLPKAGLATPMLRFANGRPASGAGTPAIGPNDGWNHEGIEHEDSGSEDE